MSEPRLTPIDSIGNPFTLSLTISATETNGIIHFGTGSAIGIAIASIPSEYCLVFNNAIAYYIPLETYL